MKKNHPVSSDQIPNYYRANRPGFYQWLGKYFLYILGWQVNGEIAGVKDGENLVVIVAPHTSNWDGALGLATIIGLDARISFIGKHTVFRFGLGWFLKSLGGIPVNIVRTFINISRPTTRAAAIFGAFVFSLYLLYDFNLLKKAGEIADLNNWNTAFTIAFTIYLDIINLLLEILEAMGD